MGWPTWGQAMDDSVEDQLVDLIQAVWAAEEFNTHCTDNPISLPISESELTAVLKEASGVDIVGELATAAFSADLTLRDHAKSVVRGYLAGGCESELAESKRNAIVTDLTKIAVLYEQD